MPAIRDAVSGSELDRFLRNVSREVRLSGTPEEARAFDFIQAELESFGYQVSRYASDALIGYPERASLEIVGDPSTKLTANGYSLSPRTSDDGVTGDLLYVGGGQPDDYAGIDARGKIVISDGLAMPGKALAAARAGAIGQIHINDEHIHEMCISPVWGTPIPETANLLPSVPSVGVNNVDGAKLKEALARGPVQVRLMTQPFLAWTKIPTLTGDLPGTDEDRFVLFSGHVDSWHYGVMDNGTANATQLEVARVLAQHKGELRRGIRLAFWSGHSHGRYASSAWYADAHWHDIHERCVCHVNVDSVGAIGANVLEDAPTMAETYGFGKALLQELADVNLEYKRISRSSDQSFWGHGIPTLFASLSEQVAGESATGTALAQLLGGGGRGGGLGWWWHTTEDLIDKIDPALLVRDAGIYVETLWRLCTIERLPFDYAATADEIASALAGYQDAAGDAFDLAGTRDLALQLASALRSAHLDRLDAGRANALVIALGRLLVPINYTRTGPFEHDLALSIRPLPGLSDAAQLAKLEAGSNDFHFLRTKLTRERNRVEHALRAAIRLVEDAGVPVM